MPEVHYELVKLKRNVAWKRGREEAEVLLQALLAYATTNQLAKYQEQLKGMVKLSPEKWLPGNKLSVQWTTLEHLAELTEFARQEGICCRSLDQTREGRKKRQVGNALECLKCLGIREGEPIKAGSNSWEFTLQLRSKDPADNLKWLFKPGGEWDRRYQEWQRRYKNGGGDEESETLQPELSPVSSPYRGLFAFGVDDEQFFFGRESFTEKLVKAVHSKPAIAVTGSSGSGKSSVVFAGLIPELKRESTWLIDSFRPKSQPFLELAALKICTLARLHQAIYGVQELNRLQGHKASVTSIDFTPDGQILASASEDGTVRLWDLEGNLIKTIRVWHGSCKLSDMSFSPNGQILAVANEWTINLLSLDGTVLREFDCDRGFTSKTVSFSPNGQLLASTDVGTLKLWRLNTNEVQTFQDRYVGAMSFSPDSQLLACATMDTLELWNLDGIVQKTLVRRRAIHSVCFSLDGKRIAAANWKWIFLWSLDSSEPQIYEHSYVVNSISFSPDGKMLASANSDGTIKLWSLDGDELQTFRGHCTQINKISFSPDGQVLASAGQDGTVKLWSLKTNKLPTLRGHSKGINKISFSPDGQMLASASNDGMVKFWNLDGSESKTFQGRNTCVTDVSFTPDGQRLVSFCKNDSVNLWNLNDTTLKTFKVDVPHEVFDIALSPDGQTLIVTSDRSDISPFSITLWSINGSLIKTLKEPYIKALSPPIFTSFSPDGHVIACADYYGEVKLYSYDGYEGIEKLHTFKACNHSVKNVSFSPSGEIIVLATEGGTVSLWSLNGKELETFQASRSEVTSVGFSPDGKILASDGDYRTVKLWTIEGIELHTFQGHSGAVSSVSFSPDGQMLASASTDGTIILWNLNLDELLVQACDWLRDYLKTNPNVSESDRHLCDGIGTQK